MIQTLVGASHIRECTNMCDQSQISSKHKVFLVTVCTLFFSLFSVLVSDNADAAELNVQLTGLSNDEGEIVVSVYCSEAEFLKTPTITQKVPAQQSEMVITIPGLSEGECAVTLYQDKNMDGKLDKNIFGIPKEAWGGSIRGGGEIRRMPKWKNFYFAVPAEGASIAIAIQ